jgi:phage shock protein PspC (stress-responsive transcriptional regulator)
MNGERDQGSGPQPEGPHGGVGCEGAAGCFGIDLAPVRVIGAVASIGTERVGVLA